MVKDEKKMISNGDEESVLAQNNKVKQVTHAEKLDQNSPSKPSSPDQNDLGTNNQEDQLKSTKAEMDEVREENERLKLTLSQIMKEYQSLQVHFHDIISQAEESKNTDSSSSHQEVEEPELVSLSLGRSSSEPKKEEKINNSSKSSKKDDEFDHKGLALGLECKFDPGPVQLVNNLSPENSFELKGSDVTETWPPSKSLKTMRSGDDDDVLQQNPLKKARVSVRARCDTPTMNDGCQWRKYGQKIAKGNPCPRAYYRCTISSSCPVRKQVQRCAEDMSILTTTYEGTHNHPLPVAATAMASTTSAAVSMLNSTSSSSTSHPGLPTTIAATTNLHGLNFTLTNNNTSRPPHPLSFSNSSFSSSTSQSHPTITLDLTVPNSGSSLFSRPLTSTFPSAPRFNSSTSLNFSSEPNNNTLQTSWNNNGYSINYGTNSNNNRNPSTVSPYQPYYMLKNNQSTTPQQQSLTEKISAATKAITSNPSFQSALAAAITSFVGNTGARVPENRGGGEVGCASSYLNRLPSLNSQQGSLNLFPQPLPFPATKNASVSPNSTEEGDHIK